MNIFKFDADCFSTPCSEETIEFIFSSKLEFSSLKDFSISCIKKQYKIQINNNISIDFDEILEQFTFRKASAEEIEIIRAFIDEIRLVDIKLEESYNFMTLFEPDWNSQTYTFESNYSYYFIDWFTSA